MWQREQNEQRVKRVRIKDINGNVLLDWSGDLFATLKVTYEGGRMLLIKEGMFWTDKYAPSITETVEIEQ